MTEEASLNKKVKFTDSDVWTIFNNYPECEKIVAYVMKKYPNFFSKNEAMHIAVYMLDKGYTLQDILSGKYDDIIDYSYQAEIITQKSVLREQEERKYVPVRNASLKPRGKFSFKKIVITLAIGASILAVVPVIKNNDVNKDNDISKTIGLLIAEPGDEDYIHKRNIVSQNTIALPGTDGAFYYNVFGIASDILRVSNGDYELFDLCLLDTYYNLKMDKLRNMDDVYFNLKLQAANAGTLTVIEERLDRNGIFLDYLLNICTEHGLIKKDSSYYERCQVAINNYRTKRVEIEGEAFNNLDDYDKETIEDLIAKGYSLREVLAEKYKPMLDEWVKEKEQIREGNRNL